MTAYGKTDKGRVRATNQDAFAIVIEEEVSLLVVCDGMGGANAGNVASRFATDTFMRVAKEHLQKGTPDAKEMQALLVDATSSANEQVYALSCAQPEFSGMGTTLVGAVATAQHLILVNVGDSRAYRIGHAGAERLTEDHSYVEEMVRSGKITQEAARTHPQKNLITRAIGVDPEVLCDLYEVELADDEVLLLCSDGLSGMLLDERIDAIVHNAKSMEDAVDNLIAEAIQNGGTDNITAVLFTRGNPERKE